MTVVEAPVVPAIREKTREEILRDAATIIEEFGWTQGAEGMPIQRDHMSPVCILGAVGLAMGMIYGPDDDAYQVTGYVVFDGEDRDPSEAYEWNDNDAESEQQVTGALRRLADGASWEEAIS